MDPATRMDINARMDMTTKLTTYIQNLKEQLKTLMVVSADTIERNSVIDSGQADTNSTPHQNALPRFELLLEDFLSTCSMIELNLRTIQEGLYQSRASLNYLPIGLSSLKHDNVDSKPEPIEPNTMVSHNQFYSAIKYQVEQAKAIKSILEDFVNKQQLQQQQQQQHQQQQQQQQLHQHHLQKPQQQEQKQPPSGNSF